MRVSVVGAGVMGLATAVELARRGDTVTVFERDTVGNDVASSTDRSKVFRFAYPDPFYADLGRRSLALWRALEHASGERLLEQCGVLYLDERGDEAREADAALAAIGAPHELLDAAALRRRFPQFTPPESALGAWDPSGGFIRADRAVAALARLARNRGAEIRERSPVRDLASLRAEAVVLAAGPWSRGLLPDLPLRTTLQQTIYAIPHDPAPYAPERFPVFIETRSGFYGLPIHADPPRAPLRGSGDPRDGALKLALHQRGQEHPPLERQREADPAFIEACRAFWRAYLPGLADAAIVASRSCIYNDTPDEDFLIDRHPSGAVVCTGFSGHGFKFAPLMGRLAAQLVHDDPTDVPLGRFALAKVRA